jgi:hypothetical protein
MIRPDPVPELEERAKSWRELEYESMGRSRPSAS